MGCCAMGWAGATGCGRLTGLERLNRQQRIELAFNYGIH
jgi:hypothetical protein